jgi:hypothetical protein
LLNSNIRFRKFHPLPNAGVPGDHQRQQRFKIPEAMVEIPLRRPGRVEIHGTSTDIVSA